MLDWIQALTPLLSAFIGVITYSSLTNYRLDLLDKQVAELGKLKSDLNNLDKRVSILEVNAHDRV